tara:strand:- start:1930 stop:2163 length:234 start_codon:yes stop_codon:yes gene_type:complete
MNDHQDSENFTYNRTWAEIEEMLDKAERKQNLHLSLMAKCKYKGQKIEHMRNYKALEGVIKSLRWVLGDLHVEHPLE